MRVKKGFTLAEILIVLIVIGAIAMMTIPSLLKGVNEAQWKTAYKKAYNAIVNLTAMEKISGSLSSTANSLGVRMMYNAMNKNLSVKDYANYASSQDPGQILGAQGYLSGTAYLNPTTGNQENCPDEGDCATLADDATNSPWIITEDNIAYAVFQGTGNKTNATCSTKAVINAQSTPADAAGEACVFLLVDVNGLSNGPNKLEPQISDSFDSTQSMDTLTGDRFYIYIGSDGATAGNKKSLVTGRIVGDLK